MIPIDLQTRLARPWRVLLRAAMRSACLLAFTAALCGLAPPAAAQTPGAGASTLQDLGSSVPGSYVFTPPTNAGYAQNDWHFVTIVRQGAGYRWTNKAGAGWNLTLDLANLKLRSGPDNPYYAQYPNLRDYDLVVVNGQFTGVRIGTDFFARNPAVMLAGSPAAAPGSTGANPIAAAPAVKGPNVSSVVIASLAGAPLGQYRQTGPLAWAEVPNSGPIVFRFEEVGRDEWSVYLVDRSRNVKLRVDLFQKKLYYADANTPQDREIYRIVSASSGVTFAGAPAGAPGSIVATPIVVPPTTPPSPSAAGACAQPWWRSRVRGPIGDANWMSAHYDLLCNVPLNALALPGAHDAGSYDTRHTLDRTTTFSNQSEVFAPDSSAFKSFASLLPVKTVYNWAKSQRRNVAEQLADGIRYLDIRVCVDGNNRLMTCHTLYGASLNNMLDDVKRFVDAHPGEIVILGFNHFWDAAYQQSQVAAGGEGLRPEMWQLLLNTIKTKLAGRLMPSAVGPGATYAQAMNGASAAATRQVIAMFDRVETISKDDPVIWTQQEAQTYNTEGIWERDAFLTASRVILDKAAKDDYAAKFWAIRSSVTPDNKLIGRSFDPISTVPNSLEELAAQTNPVVFAFLRDEWRGNANRLAKPVNLIWSDFYDRDDLVKLAKHLNGISVNWSGSTVGQAVSWGTWRGTDYSYGRGGGNVMGCAAGEEQNGALCYPLCRDGYGGAGPVCWQRCPSNFTNLGADCGKPAPYGNGGGYPWKFGDALNDNGMIARCQAAHGAGNCEKHGLLFYPKCRAGFSAFGGNVCSPTCPAGMANLGVSCQKQSYGRTAGRPLSSCSAGQEVSGALCYPTCKAGFKGVGPMCWPVAMLR